MGSSKDMFDEAYRLFKKDWFSKAIPMFEELIDRDYKSASSNFYLGEMWYYRKKYDDAIKLQQCYMTKLHICQHFYYIVRYLLKKQKILVMQQIFILLKLIFIQIQKKQKLLQKTYQK